MNWIQEPERDQDWRTSRQNEVSVTTALFSPHQLEQIGRQLSREMKHYPEAQPDGGVFSGSSVLIRTVG